MDSSADPTITALALAHALVYQPALARMSPEEARLDIVAAIRVGVRAGRVIETIHHATRAPQSLVQLGPDGDAWGTAVIKDDTCVTILNKGGTKYVLGRSRAAEEEMPPVLLPLPPVAGLVCRFRVTSSRPVVIEVLADGTARVALPVGEPRWHPQGGVTAEQFRRGGR